MEQNRYKKLYLSHLEEEFDYLQTRRTGASTRLVDYYVQELFNTGKVIVKDHCDTTNAHRFLFRTFLKRLQLEHPHIMDDIVACSRTLTVKFKGEV